MTVEQIVDAAVSAPGSLSKEGLAFRESQVREAETALQGAKKSVTAADAKVNSLARKQEVVNSRLAEVNAALKDKTGLRAVLADLKAVKAEAAKRTALEQEKRLLTEALQLLVSGDLAEAELAAKEARLNIKRTQRDWCVCKATEEAATLWAAMAPAMKRDPSLTVQMEPGGVVVQYAKKIAELDREIDELGAALARETSILRQAAAGIHIQY